ncbi:MAG: KamA family radical SAM protein [Halobacteriovoraceae bacterium]|jgi:lysine 2,3-aminomutase|nr:KamA family radical SAM protein [Halobacteriovoraceae bacterium]
MAESLDIANEMEKIPELQHRNFRNDEFWKQVPAWSNVSREEFADSKWQLKNSIRKLDQMNKVLGKRVSKEFMADIEAGLKLTPMNIRITPYIFALIDWDNPADDPLRKQFLPLGSQFIADHPFYREDSLSEDVDSPVETLTHRYADKVLFLPTTICPVYCLYCTRSRIIGGSTDTVEKDTYGVNPKKWDAVFEYLMNHPKVEDVVISGGDAYMLTPAQIRTIGENLLRIPHIRRIRLATKGIAIFPQKILTDDAWVNAVLDIVKLGRSYGKQVVIHTHFSSPLEITKWSQMAMDRLFQEGVYVRNQAVMQNGVNNKVNQMVLLTRQLSFINIQPYYVYVHDMVPGCEHFRTTLREAVELEKAVRGTTAGFNTPTFVCDLPGGGGKRHVASYEYYDEENGISLWQAPYVKPGEVFMYYDPIHKLSPEAQKRWQSAKERENMVIEAKRKAGF